MTQIDVEKIAEPVRAEIQVVEASAKADAESLATFVVENQAQLDMVGTLLLEVKAKAAELDAKRKAITQPLYSAMTQVNDLFRPALQYLGQCEQVLKRAIAEFRLREQERTAALHAKASEAAAAGDLVAAGAALEQVATTATLQGVTTVPVWRWTVDDHKAIPREWMIVDVARLDKHCASVKPPEQPAPVPGIRFVEDVRVIGRTKALKGA